MVVAQSEEEATRVASLQALGRIGEAEATLFLIQQAMASSGREQEAARHALSRLRGADPVILEALEAGNPALRPELLNTVIARRISEAAPLLLDQFVEADMSQRGELLQALAEVADPEHLDMIIPLLLAVDEPAESEQVMGVVATVAERSESAETSIASISAALQEETEPAAKRNLYAALGKIADPLALPLLEQGLEDADARQTVVEALGAWPNDAPMPLLRAAMERFAGSEEGARALAGYVRLAGLDKERTPEATVGLYKEAMAFAETPEDKQLVIAAIGTTGNASALPALYDALISDNPEVALAAVRALGAWPDASPMTRLELLAKDGPDALKLEALRGYLRLVGINHEIGGEEAAARFREALSLAPNPAEKKRIMSGLANADTLGALLVVSEYLDDPELKSEAQVAVIKIAANIVGSHPGQVRDVLDKVETVAESDFIRGEINKVREQIARFEDYITAWEAAGTYTLDDADLKALFDAEFPPEQQDADIHWRPIPVGTNNGMPFLIELDKAFGGNNRVAYLRTNVWSDAARDVLLEVGTDDGVKIWLNGELVHAHHATRPVAPAQDTAEAALQEGWNAVLMKVTQGGGEWSACLRFRTPDGGPIEGLRASTTPN